MTFEELKEEAAKLGYRLVPASTYIKLLPCKCGYKHPEQWYGNASGYFYQCPQCRACSCGSKTIQGAKRNWNEFISKEVVSNG